MTKSKRQEKNARRQRRRQSEAARRNRREERLSQPLQEPAGWRKLEAIEDFFRTERHRIELASEFYKILADVEELSLLLVNEHRHTIAAGILAILDKYRAPAIGIEGQYPGLVESSRKIATVNLEEGVKKVEHLDELSMYWLVFGDMKYLRPIYDIAIDEEHKWSPAAIQVLSKFESSFEEVADWMQGLRGVSPDDEQLSEEERQDIKDMQALANELRNSPQWHRIVFVRLENDTIVIGTQTEGPIPEAPFHWRGKPVLHAVATPVERARHEKWLADMEDAI